MTFWGLPSVINQLKSNQRLDHPDFTFWKLDRMIVSILCTLCDMLWLAEQFVVQLKSISTGRFFLLLPIFRFIKREKKEKWGFWYQKSQVVIKQTIALSKYLLKCLFKNEQHKCFFDFTSVYYAHFCFSRNSINRLLTVANWFFKEFSPDWGTR